MVLVAFVTLIISILSLYAQVLSVQSAKIYARQTQLMQTMETWHATAVGLVFPSPNTPPGPSGITPGNLNGLTGCRLTQYVNTTTQNGSGAPPICNGNLYVTLTPGLATSLPPGYNVNSYTFYSLMYQDPNTTTYVLTYAHDTDSAGYLLLPDQSGKGAGYSLGDLNGQFRHMNQGDILYGTVTAPQTLTIVNNANDGALSGTSTITIPSSVPVNSIALISAAQ